MKLYLATDEKKVSCLAADKIEQIIKRNPHAVLGLATGSTPIGTYKELVHRYQDGKIDFSNVKTFNLDEYYGLDSGHPQSYLSFMNKHLFQHINIKAEHIHIPFGTPDDIPAYCRQYEQMIEKAGGIDLQILGIGGNGHIGFNEPSHELKADTHFVRLAEETIQDNARFFATVEDVPKSAITMGIQTIMKAKEILLLALGKEKAEPVQHLFSSGITTDFPASLLKLHPNVTVLVDKYAGQLIENKHVTSK